MKSVRNTIICPGEILLAIFEKYSIKRNASDEYGIQLSLLTFPDYSSSFTSYVDSCTAQDVLQLNAGFLPIPDIGLIQKF